MVMCYLVNKPNTLTVEHLQLCRMDYPGLRHRGFALSWPWRMLFGTVFHWLINVKQNPQESPCDPSGDLLWKPYTSYVNWAITNECRTLHSSVLIIMKIHEMFHCRISQSRLFHVEIWATPMFVRQEIW